ncbi:ankyrin repeat protein [Teladorsagia circumcincta]|uniref:Ankyrin repeat protein n=1 Tax=Teladorsagia circumcincta TaxID=45464 RepID=A0A2G9TWR8_TELCI|nr:ankyrin repeat protein [Teladorsagia circumcincta]
MVQSGSNRRPWVEAASSAFAVASALPVTMNSLQIADLFEKVERLEPLESCPLTAELSSLRNAEEWSALLNAAHKGHTEVVKILLESGANVDFPDSLGWSPLMWAVYKCHPDIVDLLLNYGVGNFACVCFLILLIICHALKFEAHVNLIDEEDGLTPLIVAAGRGFTAVVERLLAADAQVIL